MLKEIINAHSGSIFVESETGKRARFIIELPLKIAIYFLYKQESNFSYKLLCHFSFFSFEIADIIKLPMTRINHSRPNDIFNEFEELQFDKILKRLPPTLTEITIEKSSVDEVLNILIGAKILIAFGAIDTSKKFIELVKKRFEIMPKKELLTIFKKNFIIFLGLLYDLHHYDELHAYILSYDEDVINTLLNNDPQFKSLWILTLMEKSKPEPKVAMEYYQQIQKESVSKSIADYLRINFLCSLYEQKVITAQEALQRSLELDNVITHQAPFYLSNLKARIYLALGDHHRAHEHISKFIQFLSPNLVHVNYQAQALLNSIKPATSINSKVLLYLLPKLRARISTKKLIENEDEDLLVIRGDELKIKKYTHIEHEKKESVLDLVSGYYRHKNRKTFLSKNRILAIKAIISMGQIGIKDVLIGEYVFLDENIGFNSVRKRSQDLVTQLQNIDIPIIRKDNTIFYDFLNSPLTVIIGADESRGEIAYLKKKYQIINKKIITYELMTKPSTSSLYLKKWREENKIVPTNNPYGDYRFS